MRADAGVDQGSGHVMRCLTLAAGLRERGHDVHFMASIQGVDWLEEHLRTSGFTHEDCTPDQIDLDRIRMLEPDWVVVDSYRIDAASVSATKAVARTLAIIDGEDRGVDADVYLDCNLGAEATQGADSQRLLGARFALVRSEWVELAKRGSAHPGSADVHVLAVMGGTDPSGSIVEVAKAVASLPSVTKSTIIAPRHLLPAAESLGASRPGMTVLPTTTRLPELAAAADVVVTASGTSAWDFCTAAKPAVLIAVAENQRLALSAAMREGVAFGIDAIDDLPAIGRQLVPMLSQLIEHPTEQEQLVRRCRAVFDGMGVRRVIDALEAAS